MAMLAFEINKRQPLAEGRSFGATGPYEQIDGTAHFGVDPAHPDNRDIADIALAPRDPTGLVRFAADVTILTPREPERGNRRLLLDGRRQEWPSHIRHPLFGSDWEICELSGAGRKAVTLKVRFPRAP